MISQTNQELRHPVPKDLLTEIGDMTVTFALLEEQWRGLFESLLREKQRVGQIIANNLSLGDILIVTLNLHEEKYGTDTDLQRLQTYAKETKIIEAERNRVTHSIWGAAEKATDATRMKITTNQKSGFQHKSEIYTVERMQAFNRTLRRLAANLLECSLHIKDPSPNDHPR